MSYFNNPKTLEELKIQYRFLAFNNHPDRGGDGEIMKAINCEYDDLFSVLKNIHRNKDGNTYTSNQTNKESADQFKDLIAQLMNLDDIVIEIIGCFVWVTGNTKIHKEKLRELKFQWHSKKIAWFLKPEDYQIKSRRDYAFDEIRSMYGTSGEINSKRVLKLTKGLKNDN